MDTHDAPETDQETDQTQLVAVAADHGPSLDLVIAAWLDAKSKRTGSAKTARAYRDTLTVFRQALTSRGLDLDADGRAVALYAQAWASRTRPDGQAVSANTYNQRLAILSSFYAFGQKRGLLTCGNPLVTLDRRPIEEYATARALDFADVAARLQAIDRSELSGKRDYALLVLALHTGRRLAELAGLRARHLELRTSRAGRVPGKPGKPSVLIVWPRAKGDKHMEDALPAPVSAALLDWLSAVYGAGVVLAGELVERDPDAPLWISLAHNGSRGRALSHQAIAAICEKRLGTAKVHTLRHTFAHAMEEVGAKVSDIQARLGHSSLATTGKYLAALKSAENAHADDLVALFGLQPATATRRAPAKRTSRR